jgi:hypothetical protein
MRIGITFGDNDFNHTMKPFMIFLMRSIQDNPDLKNYLTKDYIADIFNKMAEPIYHLCQNGLRRSWPPWNDYLKIDTSRIYLEDEIDEKLKTYPEWANNDFFYIDTDNDQIDCW